MKRIIDIDENYFEIIKHDVKIAKGSNYKPFVLIANSIPYEERPQGEWINTSPYDIDGECSLCCYLSNKCYNYCPNCGAKMLGGEE